VLAIQAMLVEASSLNPSTEHIINGRTVRITIEQHALRPLWMSFANF